MEVPITLLRSFIRETHGFLQPTKMRDHYNLHNAHGHPRAKTEATDFARPRSNEEEEEGDLLHYFGCKSFQKMFN